MSLQGNLAVESAMKELQSNLVKYRTPNEYGEVDLEDVLDCIEGDIEEIRKTAAMGYY